MKTFTPLFISILLGTGCITEYRGQTLSEFKLNNHRANWRIVNRYPDYGDGRPEGCIIRPEMRMELFRLKPTGYRARITDVETGLPVTNATVLITFRTKETIKSRTDSLGNTLIKSTEKLRQIKVEAGIYRGLLISL